MSRSNRSFRFLQCAQEALSTLLSKVYLKSILRKYFWYNLEREWNSISMPRHESIRWHAEFYKERVASAINKRKKYTLNSSDISQIHGMSSIGSAKLQTISSCQINVNLYLQTTPLYTYIERTYVQRNLVFTTTKM